MTRLDRQQARAILRIAGADPGVDFHALSFDVVERLLEAATALRYRRPKMANGSTARSFHAFLKRRGYPATELEWQVRQYTGASYGWEVVTIGATRTEAMRHLREYRIEYPQFPVKLVHARVRVEDQP